MDSDANNLFIHYDTTVQASPWTRGISPPTLSSAECGTWRPQLELKHGQMVIHESKLIKILERNRRGRYNTHLHLKVKPLKYGRIKEATVLKVKTLKYGRNKEATELQYWWFSKLQEVCGWSHRNVALM